MERPVRHRKSIKVKKQEVNLSSPYMLLAFWLLIKIFCALSVSRCAEGLSRKWSCLSVCYMTKIWITEQDGIFYKKSLNFCSFVQKTQSMISNIFVLWFAWSTYLFIELKPAEIQLVPRAFIFIQWYRYTYNFFTWVSPQAQR